jgi:rhamnulokinase
MTTRYLACDLGAESGRLMLGTLSDGRLALEEVHRFPNVPLKAGGSLHWDIPFLFEELKTGLREAANRRISIASISADSWGVDYTLFDHSGSLISPTFHYRDARTARGVGCVQARVDWPTLFHETGIQFMPLNTIYQLAAELPERLASAERLLMIADAFNYLLCGEAKIEESNASTTQLYNPGTKQWSDKLISALGLPRRLFPPIIPAGTKLGTLKPDLASASGLQAIDVIASCSHDTGAAVAGIPASDGNWAYVSSGTWSLMGVELASPVLSAACRELNFTNEIGFGGSVRLLKNIIGLWLVQECRRHWAGSGQEYDYATLTRLAEAAPAFRSLVNPADPRFIPPGDMPANIANFCRETGQPVPESPGSFIRCALESLALLYRRTLGQIESLMGKKTDCLHIVGGGSRNALLNQFTANALQIPVLAGPVEATAAGNILIQAIALGHLTSLAAAREVVKNSFETALVGPSDAAAWQDQYRRFEAFFE